MDGQLLEETPFGEDIQKVIGGKSVEQVVWRVKWV